ncbi:unnamed protein product [Peronospora destructor]|uniref:Integrator complex subunit 4/Protein SIEL C-terminal Ig-like domain-containing protein n=1 Tax=Peronospora destructor TaxID=86335 RepID=A0AAV0V8X3_9STRA|nr:unnamed protein product [Peronospora destructor]
MSSIAKREREWKVSTLDGDTAEIAANVNSKRPRLCSPTSSFSSDVISVSQSLTITSVEGFRTPHPMTVLDAIRTKLQSTSDPHLQARLLIQYSSAAASPRAMTAAAIDFLFSFLQQNQTQSETPTDGNQTNKDTRSSGGIVVGAIVRGLRQLLAVKAAVVEPMIQVDAMGEQLMQCMSVGEDFKLRRDMMRIAVDCLMLTSKYKQVEMLLRTCVQDHDTGMQTICLRGYLRLDDDGRCFAVAQTASNFGTVDVVAEHFDRFAAFVLFAQSDEVKVLAAQVLVALANRHPQHETANSKYFPSLASVTTAKMPLFLPEKTFYVLCMAGYDTEDSVRAEVARCLRRFSRVLRSDVVEHAVIKTQIDEAVIDVLPEVLEMNTRRMMSSGVLLSLLEDVDMNVSAEASRTIARLSEMAMTPDAGAGQWSKRVLERAITAHFDILPRAKMPSAAQLCHVLVNSLGRLLACRHRIDTKTKFTISSTDLSCLVGCAVSSTGSSKVTVVGTLLVFQYCDLSSIWAVQHLVDFVLEIATLPLFDRDDDIDEDADYWNERLLATIQTLGNKCAKVLQADVALSDRLQREVSTQHNSKHRLFGRVCQALLGHMGLANGEKSANTDKAKPPSDGSSLFFLDRSPLEASHVLQKPRTVSTRAVSVMETLWMPPSDETIAVYLKAIRRLRTALATDDLDVSFRVADTLVRLRQYVQSFPDASAAPTPTVHKYVSMEAMLSTSPSVTSGHTKNSSRGSQDQNEAQAFAHLYLPTDLQKGCQDIVDAASGLYIKAFALSLLPRTELLQLVLLGRVGLVLASVQNSTDSCQTTENLRWVGEEATRLCFLINDNKRQDDVWLPIQSLSEVRSLNELKRAFVAIVRKAWPAALIETAISRFEPPTSGIGSSRYQHVAVALASIQEPTSRVSTKLDPREVTANWPFDQRVHFSLTNVRDVTQVYIKSVLPNGNVAHHHVPGNCIRIRGPRKHWVEHTIRLTVSPFSDPTAFVVAVCLGHPTLPGSVKQNAPGSGEASLQMFTEISASVRVPIFHRTSYTLRQAKLSTAP